MPPTATTADRPGPTIYKGVVVYKSVVVEKTRAFGGKVDPMDKTVDWDDFRTHCDELVAGVAATGEPVVVKMKDGPAVRLVREAADASVEDHPFFGSLKGMIEIPKGLDIDDISMWDEWSTLK